MPLEINIRIGKEIEAARLKKEWNQTKLSEVSGVAQKTISRIENAKDDICIVTLSKIADALGYRFPDKLLIKKSSGAKQ